MKNEPSPFASSPTAQLIAVLSQAASERTAQRRCAMHVRNRGDATGSRLPSGRSSRLPALCRAVASRRSCARRSTCARTRRPPSQHTSGGIAMRAQRYTRYDPSLGRPRFSAMSGRVLIKATRNPITSSCGARIGHVSQPQRGAGGRFAPGAQRKPVPYSSRKVPRGRATRFIHALALPALLMNAWGYSGKPSPLSTSRLVFLSRGCPAPLNPRRSSKGETTPVLRTMLWRPSR